MAERLSSELQAELLTLARTYDPNCDEYHFEDQKLAMDYARRCVDSLQELACYFGSDPEGDLTALPDDAMGRIDDLETKIAELEQELSRLRSCVVLTPEQAGRVRLEKYQGQLTNNQPAVGG